MPTSPRQYRFRTVCPKGRDVENGRDVEDAVPYNLFRQMLPDWPGGRGRPPLQFVKRYVFSNARAPRTKTVGADPCVRPCCFPHTLSEPPGGRGWPPLQFVFGNVIQKAGRIISAPTFTHTFSPWPGRRGQPPLQFVSANIAFSPIVWYNCYYDNFTAVTL